jgi:hypothetical protein
VTVHAVVNRLRLASTAPTDLWERAQTELLPRMMQVDGFEQMHVVEMAPGEVVVIIVADAAETLDRIATEAGNSWMIENVIPHIAEPPDRQVGKIVVSSHAGR